MKVKELIEELETFDKNLDVLVGDEWIDGIDLVEPKARHEVPYVSIIKEREVTVPAWVVERMEKMRQQHPRAAVPDSGGERR